MIVLSDYSIAPKPNLQKANEKKEKPVKKPKDKKKS